MNPFIAAFQNAYDEYLTATKKAVEGLSTEEAYRQPAPDSNPIGWIVWHMARVEDHWLNGLFRDAGQVWNRGGWDKKFGMDSEARGAGQTIEEVMSMPKIPIADLLAYFDAVRAETAPAIASVTDAQLEQVFNHPRFGEKTGAWIVSHIIVEESQHTGQVAMVRGMLRGFNE